MIRTLKNRLPFVLTQVGVYYLSLVLIAFAFPKFYNGQFQIYQHSGYIPLNQTSLFTHAWSFFGRSYAYNLFIGMVEFCAGVCLLFPRTRLLALLVALGLFVNILIIDLEFDVEAAVAHVCLELLVILLLLIPYLKSLRRFFWEEQGLGNPSSGLWTRLVPWIFVGLLSIGFSMEAYFFVSEQQKDIASFQIESLHIDNQAYTLNKGKQTPFPMLFFEFGNTLIWSVNDLTIFGSYQREGSAIRWDLDKPVLGIRKFKGQLNPSRTELSGVSDSGQQIRFRLKEISSKK